MSLYEAVRQALLLNELSGNAAAAYHWANAGKTSGLSFGATQLDISHNTAAVACLKECGYDAEEIERLKAKDRSVSIDKLVAHKNIVDRYDTAQIRECLDHVMTVAKSRGFSFASDEAIVHAADYHNQFYMSTSGKMSNFLTGLGRPVQSGDIFALVKTTGYAQVKENLEDLKRRYNNIARLMGGETVG